jgi:hypothetical protein
MPEFILETTLPQGSIVRIELLIIRVSDGLLSVQIELSRFTIFSTVPLAGTTSAGTSAGIALGDGDGVGEGEVLLEGDGDGDGIGSSVGAGTCWLGSGVGVFSLPSVGGASLLLDAAELSLAPAVLLPIMTFRLD